MCHGVEGIKKKKDLYATELLVWVKDVATKHVHNATSDSDSLLDGSSRSEMTV